MLLLLDSEVIVKVTECGLCPSPAGEERATSVLLRSIGKGNLKPVQSLRIVLRDPTEQVSSSSHLKMETYPESETLRFLFI
jgi:hypothetical protein